MRPAKLCLTLSALLLLVIATPMHAQTPAPAPPAPNPRDVATMDAIVAALYDVISGPAGQARDWDRFRSLFHPTGRMMPTRRNADGTHVMQVVDAEGYVTRTKAILEGQGFFEREVARKVERFGSIAHVWSTYEARRTLADPQPFLRGVNTIQLFWDGSRWWVLSVAWSPETPDQPLPACYLPGGDAGADCPAIES